jgi:hypothetical protein
MKVMLGITTFNRESKVIDLCRSINAADNISKCKIIFFDDNSSDLDFRKIEAILIYKFDVIRNKKNLGADLNTYQMYKYFLNSDLDLLVNLDSDMIVNKNFYTKIIENIDYCEGILSLYNSNQHQSIQTVTFNNTDFEIKKDIGAAGTVFSKGVIRDIIDNVKESESFDWDWSKYLVSKGKKLFVTQKTYIQHLGFDGQNCKSLKKLDFGLNYEPDNIETQIIYLRNLENFVLKLPSKMKEVETFYKRSYSYRIGKFLISPIIFFCYLLNKAKKALIGNK